MFPKPRAEFAGTIPSSASSGLSSRSPCQSATHRCHSWGTMPSPAKRLFLTGATGFIGSRIVRQALERGHELAVLILEDDSATRLEPDQLENVRVIRGALAD